METETLLFILIAVFAALLIAIFQYVFKNKEKGQLKYWLSFLRFLTYFSIFLLIINPSIKKITTEIVKPKLVVAVDNSTSIKYISQNTAIENLVNLFKNNVGLNDKYSIEYYSFGKNVTVLDSLKFNENQTNISLPFEEFSKLYKTESTPVVVITDGNQTVGNNVEFINYKSPIFPFIIGDTTVFEDIYIHQLNVNKFTNINNKFPVEIFINYVGTNSISKKLNIFHKGKIVHSKVLQFSKTSAIKTESFFLTAEENGIQYYTAKISALENEKNTINNSKSFSVNVIEEKSKILILTSIVHPDLGMLKKSIESNQQRLVTISNIKDFKGDLSDYQLIILNQPSNKFKAAFETINDKKQNYLIISGLSTDWNFLNKIQNNFSKNVIRQTENYLPVFNSNYASFLSDAIEFSNFAPLEDQFGDVSFSIPYQALLFQQIGTIKTEKPLLATFENNNQRGAILLGENTWRWRMNSFTDSKTFEVFDGFISNLIQYLTSNEKNKRLSVYVDPIYYANEMLQISAIYLDKNFNFDARSKLWLSVSSKTTNFSKNIPFAALKSKFLVELSNLPSDEYSYSVAVENQILSEKGSFKILPFEIEQQFTNANHKPLKILAAKTNGYVHYSNEEAKLIKNLTLDPRFKSIQKAKTVKTPLINWKWILGLILLSLSTEWFVRKYFGKI
ncbi:VWA domain-containing protein [uncultured Lutibacter sp.]|uniref:VWA domain-containing protein n=1 Tax=uncultured Lutibacter sp. TaxID=437739 RepID=UPI00262F719A|nr:VWA domain-containing protein [uncultured Lutibacter sp.]